MVADLYYYSLVGTDSNGPVPAATIRQLAQDGVLHAGSFTCQAGANEWKPFDLAEFTAPDPEPLPPAPPEKPYVPPTPAMYSVEPWHDLAAPEETGSSDTLKLVIDSITLVIAVGYGVFQAFSIHPPWTGGGWLWYLIWYGIVFVIAVVIACAIPFGFCLIFKEVTRSVVRLLGVILAVGALLAFQPAYLGHFGVSVADYQKTDQSLNDEANRLESNVKTNPEKAKEALDKLGAQASGDTELAHGTRALVGVMNELYAKVKDAETIGSTCNFDVTTITDPDDIAKRCDALRKLRDSQGNVIDFLKNFDGHAREALTQANVTPAIADQMIAGTHKTGHFPILVVIWQTQQKLCEDHIARFEFLSKSYGSWNVKNGDIVFSDSTSKEKYTSLTQALQEDSRQIADAQKQLAPSPEAQPPAQ